MAENQDQLKKDWNEALEAAEKVGYKLIDGLFDDKSGNVYHITALCKNPEAWEPYKAPRCFADCDAMALWWSYDSDMSNDNQNGDMIYTEGDPEPAVDDDGNEILDDEGNVVYEDAPEVNTSCYEDADDALYEFCKLSFEDQQEVLRRMREVATGNITERWDAPRSDQSGDS